MQVRSVDPLRVLVCREGLVRLCSAPYQPPAPGNLRDAYAHLTNYTLNKKNKEGFVHTAASAAQAASRAATGSSGSEEEGEEDGTRGSKRKLSEVLLELERTGEVTNPTHMQRELPEKLLSSGFGQDHST